MIKLFLAITMVGLLIPIAPGGNPEHAAPKRSITVPKPDDPGSGLPPGAIQTQTTFATIKITIDPLGKPLGAYQFQLTSPDASFKVLGVEGGGHPAFDHGRPPYFDPVVREAGADRLILAEYALPRLDAEQLPSEPVLIARVAVLFDQPIDADEPPAINLLLTTAGDADGNKIQANLSHTLQIPERPE